MVTVHFRVDDGWLRLVGGESRALTDACRASLAGWAERYDKLLLRESVQDRLNALESPGELLAIGREVRAWLDGDGRWLAPLDEGAGPREIVVEAPLRPGEDERRVLNVPFELLADDEGFLAGDAVRPLLVSRRLGAPGEPQDLRHGDLYLMFMAAAPEGADNLEIEREEAGILAATEGLDVQLAVEESGCLRFLEERLARIGDVEALHISCHGQIGKDGEPFLLLEDAFGRGERATVADLAGALGEKLPPLMFVSACRTAESAQASMPLTQSLVRAGVANVIGWDGSVWDHDASAFARVLYRGLAEKRSLSRAVADARGALLRENLSDPKSGRHWHLARLYLGPAGGGAVCAAGRPRRDLVRNAGHKEFLDKEKERVPVARADQFVGRRRQAQMVLRALHERRKAGVLIHGMGRLGKSSLAARVANRMPGAQDHRAVRRLWRGRADYCLFP